jgi:cold shock CspA family protein
MKQKKSTSSWILGRVNWYDPESSKGSIIGDDGNWYRINEFSEIKTNTQNTLKVNARVKFELALDSVHPIIKRIHEFSNLQNYKQKRLKETAQLEFDLAEDLVHPTAKSIRQTAEHSQPEERTTESLQLQKTRSI